MAKGGNENRIDKLIAAVERQAEATEQMLTIAREEQITMAEPGPPVCPHCGKLNPTVTQIGETSGSGELSEFVMQAETHCCNRSIYCVPIGWDTTTHVELALDILKMRKGGTSE